MDEKIGTGTLRGFAWRLLPAAEAGGSALRSSRDGDLAVFSSDG